MTHLLTSGMAVAVCLALLSVAVQAAAPVGYTQYGSFSVMLSGPPSTLSFEAETPGTIIASGTAVAGITFVYDFEGVQLKVSTETDTGYSTTSSVAFLGTNDADILQDGDSLSLSFSPVSALGLYLITADEMADNDVTLVAGGTSVSLVAAHVQTTLPDGSKVYFLGVSGADSAFTSAELMTAGNGAFLFNVDDIVTATAADAAGDAIADLIDNCPNVPNGPSALDPEDAGISQRNTDGDSQGDACDTDDDNDLLSDVDEAAAGTDRLNADSDNDGVIDGEDQFPLNTAKAGIIGDLNGDETITLADLLMLERFLSGDIAMSPAEQYRADIHPAGGDGIQDVADLLRLQQILTQP